MTTKLKKSSGTGSKYMIHSSVSILKKDQSTSNTADRKNSVEETFDVQFKNFCEKFNAWTIPQVNVILQEPTPGDFPQLPTELSEAELVRTDDQEQEVPKKEVCVPPTVLVIFDDYELQRILNTVIVIDFLVNRSMLIALRKTFQTFDTIRTLKLEHCRLQNTDLRTLKTILQKNKTIMDLSINGNPNRFQNFYILLKDTNLMNISMSSCQINDRGANLIAQQLTNPSKQTIISINLSSNFISDNGTTSIANALRINRMLTFLNLADNWITDAGCISLMKIFRTFPLTHQEIVIRRHRIMSFLLKKAELIELYWRKLEESSNDISSICSNRKRSSSKTSSIKSARNGREKSGRKKIKTGNSSIRSLHKRDNISNNSKQAAHEEFMEQSISSKMEPDNHPFVKDCYIEDNEIYCQGNLKLIHLNLAYNKITEFGVQEILHTLNYQQTMISHVQEGLSYVILEGNQFPENCTEIENINDLLLDARTSKRPSNSSSENKRHSKQKSSIVFS